MILVSHPTANQNVRQTAVAFARAGLLQEFWTCVNWREGGPLDELLAFLPGLRNGLRRRSFSEEVRPFIRTHGFREWGRQFADQFGWSPLTREEDGIFSIDAVYLSLDRRVARRVASDRAIRAVYAYDAGALTTFRAASKRGTICIYEHPIVYWRQVKQYQLEEAELSPEWVPTLGALADSEEKRQRKDEELALADIVITPSSFARASLGLARQVAAPIHVIPYGASTRSLAPMRGRAEGKLRVLFIGILSQAKGLGYLLEAAERLASHITLTLIGRRMSPDVPRPSVIRKHHWIPSLPHSEVLREMSEHDVLVLPSLHEGFGLVITEAMAQGLVVITTSHTAGPDLLTDGVDGFLIPIRSPGAIEEKICLLDRDRERLRAMQEAARRKATFLRWENYRQRVVKLAREVIDTGVTK